MPYITKADRRDLSEGNPPKTVGQLTYVWTLYMISNSANDNYLRVVMRAEIDSYVKENGESFQTFAAVLGSVNAAVMEYARRTSKPTKIGKLLGEVSAQWYLDVVAPYEDNKIRINGDVAYPGVAA